jgi:hypothetical protein
MRSESGCGLKLKKTSPHRRRVRELLVLSRDEGMKFCQHVKELIAVDEGHLIIIIAARILVVLLDKG